VPYPGRSDCKIYADFLETIPAFSNCAREVLEDFVAYGAFKVHAGAGRMLCTQTQCDQNLNVLVSATPSLDAGDDVRCPTDGDFFGRNPGRYHELIATVIADEDVEVLAIRPQEVLQLEVAVAHWVCRPGDAARSPAPPGARDHIRPAIALPQCLFSPAEQGIVRLLGLGGSARETHLARWIL
jgi:hypothetical protein